MNLNELIWINGFVLIQAEQNRSEEIPAFHPWMDPLEQVCGNICVHTNKSKDGSGRGFPLASSVGH